MGKELSALIEVKKHNHAVYVRELGEESYRRMEGLTLDLLRKNVDVVGKKTIIDGETVIAFTTRDNQQWTLPVKCIPFTNLLDTILTEAEINAERPILLAVVE